jgi:Zn-dependent membrane protease YugP
MIYLLFVGLFFLLVYGPQLWVQSVLNRHNRKDEENFPGTGGEFARHLLDRYKLNQIKVEATDQGDHYDPINYTVRLTRDKFEGKTMTAITVAAHECSHALQHAAAEPMFQWRTRLAYGAVWAQKVGSFLLFAAPVLVLLFRIPSVAIINILGAFLMIGFAVVVQLLTLPVEIDASFNKAMPILKAGYLTRKQVPAARSILRAAAWTYVAGSLASLLNFWRWLAVLKR